jgi:hypothetical protein
MTSVAIKRFPDAFVSWFRSWADFDPVVDDPDDEDLYAAWHAGHETGFEEGGKHERDNAEPYWRDE